MSRMSEWGVVAALMVVLAFLVVMLFVTESQANRECAAKGGVYVEGKCLRVVEEIR